MSIFVFSGTPLPFLKLPEKIDLSYHATPDGVDIAEAQAIICQNDLFDLDIFSPSLKTGVPVFIVLSPDTHLPLEVKQEYHQQGVRECYQISTPEHNSDFQLRVTMALRGRQLFIEAPRSRPQDGILHGMVIGNSVKMQDLMVRLAKVARSDISVLILGESGVGKEGLAHYVHSQSERKGKFVAVNCGQLQKELAGSLLFGHMKGAFTGAATTTGGYFAEAEGGTIFLDEVFELPVDVQVQLLRTMQQGVVQSVGAKHEHKVNVRIVAATNRDVEDSIEKGILRKDFRYRFKEIVEVPSLRQRAQDIPLFLDYFVAKFGQKIHIAKELVEILQKYRWPGNVRELEGLIERWSLLHQGQTIMPQTLPPELRRSLKSNRNFDLHLVCEGDRIPTLKEVQELYIKQVLMFHDNNKAVAAKELGIARSYFYTKKEAGQGAVAA